MEERIAMKEAISCGGIVIYRGKVLLLYKNFYDHYHGWVLPKGTVEPGEKYEDTAVREIFEEGGSKASIVKYIDKTHYTFRVGQEEIKKTVNWYLCKTDAFYSKPQKEEFFEDSGFYKYNEAYHLLKFDNEREVFEKAYKEYRNLKLNNEWSE